MSSAVITPNPQLPALLAAAGGDGGHSSRESSAARSFLSESRSCSRTASASSRSRSRSASPRRKRHRRSPSSDEQSSDPETRSRRGKFLSERKPYKIPKLADFASASPAVPPPPSFVTKKEKERVRLPEKQLTLFESIAKGVSVRSSEREELLTQVPMPASVLGHVPAVDPELGPVKGAARVSEARLTELHSVILAAASALSMGEASEGSAREGYIEATAKFLGIAVQDIICIRRARVVDSLGIPPHLVVDLPRILISKEEYYTDLNKELTPLLFGSTVRGRIAAAGAGSDLLRAIEKLSGRSRQTTSSSGGRRSSRHSGHKAAKRPYTNQPGPSSGGKRDAFASKTHRQGKDREKKDKKK